MYATVIIASKQAGIGNGLTYRVGGGLGLGQLVKVPLRKRLVEGIVVELSEDKPEGDFDIREIAGVIGDAPLLSAQQIEIAKWIADYYCCTLRQAIGLFLSGNIWSSLLPKEEEWVRIIENGKWKMENFGKKQKNVVDYLNGKDWVKKKILQDESGVSGAILKKLIMSGVVEVKREILLKPILHSPFSILHSPTLTPRQTIACKAIASDPRPTLLFGVTGSGKTEIYAALIRDAIQEGKSAILLLPEILLTENVIERFQKLLDRAAIAIIHSRLTPAKRRNEWKRIRSGEIALVIGSRSALFSPLPNLGLIIIDEEHEWTYKNEQAPRYHAVKVAERLCNGGLRHAERNVVESKHLAGQSSKLDEVRRASTASFAFHAQDSAQHDVKLVLGSATPSVESWYKAKTGKYQLVELPERYGNALLPSVRVIDLGDVKFGKYYPLSPALLEAIRRRLDRHEQSILFLNRRGFATNLLCKECRYRFEDPETKLPYTVHHARHGEHVMVSPPTSADDSDGSDGSNHEAPRSYLLSHHTGQELPIPDTCPKCSSSQLLELGAGTQRIETLLSELYPSARVLRADADTLRSPEHMRLLLENMREGRADILLGTQSVVKGLDLPKVTLAAVLLADIGLSLPHFRAGERVFQLLTQLTGRSGRSQPGEVIIQTFRPHALEVALAASHNVRSYLEQELVAREKAHYPPDTQLIRFVFSGPVAARESFQYTSILKKDSTIHVSRSPTLFSGGKDWQVLVRGKNLTALKKPAEFGGKVDVDPVECL